MANIRTESRRQTRDLSEFFGDDQFERFFDFPPVPRQPRDQITQGAGSGFIIDNRGLILTNNHVVAERSGALVTAVERVVPAARAGIRAGDIVLEVNRMAMSDAADAVAALRRVGEGAPPSPSCGGRDRSCS